MPDENIGESLGTWGKVIIICPSYMYSKLWTRLDSCKLGLHLFEANVV